MAKVQVRYIVNDVDVAIASYTKRPGCTSWYPAPAFAMSRGDLRLVLSAPNPFGGGGQSMPDGTRPEPGGWNRFAIEVGDIAAMRGHPAQGGRVAGNDIVTGVGGKQIIVEDPSGNPIELFEPMPAEARLGPALPPDRWVQAAQGIGRSPHRTLARVILRAALDELGDAGYGAFTIELVCACAGVGKSAHLPALVRQARPDPGCS